MRIYDAEDLKKLLNIGLLQKEGLRISEIAHLDDEEIHEKVTLCSPKRDIYFRNLKLSVLNSDKKNFQKTYQNLSNSLEFSTIYAQYFVPLLAEIGDLWSLGIVSISKEHWASQLIVEKIMENYLQVQKSTTTKRQTHDIVLFLPENELHEISLRFANYILATKGLTANYLGLGIPFSDWDDLLSKRNTIFIGYFTMPFIESSWKEWIEKFENRNEYNNQLWLMGPFFTKINWQPSTRDIKKISNLESFIEQIELEFKD